MNIKEIKNLIDHIAKSGLQEVDIETEQIKIAIKRSAEGSAVSLGGGLAPLPTAAPVAAPVAVTNDAPAPAPAASKGESIKSPMIGTFYNAPNPESEPFVGVGTKVNKGDTLCIIEAMKLFNEIEAEVSGTIVEILIDNATPVEFDQPLFIIDPS